MARSGSMFLDNLISLLPSLRFSSPKATPCPSSFPRLFFISVGGCPLTPDVVDSFLFLFCEKIYGMVVGEFGFGKW